MNKRLNVGIIGAGRIGKVHAETLAFRTPEANLRVVADVDLNAARSLAERCGIPRVAPAAAEVFRIRPDVRFRLWRDYRSGARTR